MFFFWRKIKQKLKQFHFLPRYVQQFNSFPFFYLTKLWSLCRLSLSCSGYRLCFVGKWKPSTVKSERRGEWLVPEKGHEKLCRNLKVGGKSRTSVQCEWTFSRIDNKRLFRLLYIQFYPVSYLNYEKFINGTSSFGSNSALQIGHSDRFSTLSWIQSQQKMCPHSVLVGDLLVSRHKGHFLCTPSITVKEAPWLIALDSGLASFSLCLILLQIWRGA